MKQVSKDWSDYQVLTCRVGDSVAGHILGPKKESTACALLSVSDRGEPLTLDSIPTSNPCPKLQLANINWISLGLVSWPTVGMRSPHSQRCKDGRRGCMQNIPVSLSVLHSGSHLHCWDSWGALCLPRHEFPMRSLENSQGDSGTTVLC